MGIWIELGIFVVIILFGVQQIREVRREQAKRAARREEDSGNQG